MPHTQGSVSSQTRILLAKHFSTGETVHTHGTVNALPHSIYFDLFTVYLMGLLVAQII
jgi:hypothetical protein